MVREEALLYMLQGNMSSIISHLDSICKLIIVDYTFNEALTSSF
jgi:hypothetical protein